MGSLPHTIEVVFSINLAFRLSDSTQADEATMDALTRLHRALAGGDDDEEQPEDSILGDTEGICSLSPVQVNPGTWTIPSNAGSNVLGFASI